MARSRPTSRSGTRSSCSRASRAPARLRDRGDPAPHGRGGHPTSPSTFIPARPGPGAHGPCRVSLELRDIHKHFGAVRANDGINLTVAGGSLHGLLGENGAGKSTLMKIVSGFYTPDSGSILLDGSPIALGSTAAAIATGIGMLHQDPLLFLPMSVLDNILTASPGGMRLD